MKHLPLRPKLETPAPSETSEPTPPPPVTLGATETGEITLVRAIDVDWVIDQANSSENPHAAWAKRPRRSGISFEDLEALTVTKITGTTFEVGRISKPTDLPHAAEPTSHREVTQHPTGPSRALLATIAALVLLVLACAAIALAAG